jgi:hypothetical protein
MTSTTAGGPWIAALIEANLDALAVEAAAEGCERIPFYRTLPRGELEQGFRYSWQMQASAFYGDPLPLRNHMRAIVTARVESGATIADMMDASDLMRDLLVARIHAALAPRPTHEAVRQVEALHKTLRMLISGINLQLLTMARSAPPGAHSTPPPAGQQPPARLMS